MQVLLQRKLRIKKKKKEVIETGRKSRCSLHHSHLYFETGWKILQLTLQFLAAEQSSLNAASGWGGKRAGMFLCPVGASQVTKDEGEWGAEGLINLVLKPFTEHVQYESYLIMYLYLQTFYLFTNKQYHRVVSVGRDLKDDLISAPCHGQRCHSLNLVAQSLIQPVLGHLKG